MPLAVWLSNFGSWPLLFVYLQVLEKAETDTEKFAALFLVPKLMKGADCCDKKARMHLIEAIGYSFLGKH